MSIPKEYQSLIALSTHDILTQWRKGLAALLVLPHQIATHFKTEVAVMNNKGKHKKRPVPQGKFTVIYTSIEDHILKDSQFLALPYSARFIYLLLRMKYKGDNADKITFTCKEAESEWGISRNTLAKGLKGLVEAKIIILVAKGGLPLFSSIYSLRGRLWGIQEETDPPKGI